MKIPSEWTKESYKVFLRELCMLEDTSYKDFNFKLISTNYGKIGIRMPILKDIAKKIAKKNPISFLEIVEDTYYEEVMLEGLVITSIKELDTFFYYFNIYMTKIDNWALCDYIVANMKIVKENKKFFYKKIKKLLKSREEYKVRVGIVLLLNYYIEEYYINKIFKLCNNIKVNTYYVNMALAWLICECFIKQKTKTYTFLKRNKLNSFTQNKAISKIRESDRITKNDKMKVLDFKRK